MLINHFEDENLDFIKQIGFEFEKEYKNIVFLATTKFNQKPSILLLISRSIIEKIKLDARIIVKD